MKKITFAMLLAAIAASSKAQEMYNGGIITIGSNTAVLVNGNLTNNLGSITNNGSLTITGHITNNAAFTTSGGGNLNLNGTTTQILSGTLPLIAKNVSFNNAAGVKLATPLHIDGAATFISGVINATDSRYPVVFTTNGSVSGAPTDASHVNGYVRKEGTGSFTYPLGNATNYQPVGVNLTANTAGLTALYVPADAGNAPYGTGGTNAIPLVQYNTNEYWDLTPVGTAAGSVVVYYDGYLPTPISTNTADLRVAHQYNGQWLNEGRAAGSTGNNVSGLIVSNPVSTWSPFTFGAVSPVILPLQWLSFNGFLNSRQAATLTWHVSEKDVQRYEVEKSSDYRSYSAIGSVPSKGNGTNTYHFTEGNVLNGTAYYRIRQTDVNGRSSFSPVLRLNNGLDNSISIYPNPVKDIARVSIPSSLLNTEAHLYNAAGQKLQSLRLKHAAFTLNLNNYEAGTYLLQFSNGATVKFIKQ